MGSDKSVLKVFKMHRYINRLLEVRTIDVKVVDKNKKNLKRRVLWQK